MIEIGDKFEDRQGIVYLIHKAGQLGGSKYWLCSYSTQNLTSQIYIFESQLKSGSFLHISKWGPPKSGSYVGIDFGTIGVPRLKIAQCECGKEKHGFASHSGWCDIKET